MEFSYTARDNQGRLKTGTVEATTEAGASKILQEHSLTVIKIAVVTKLSALEHLRIFDRVSPKDIVLFSRQLATLINAKVPIVQALNILINQVSSDRLKTIIGEVAQHVESGESLSSALARYPKVFSGLYVNLVRAGELSGTMDESLSYLADQMEKDYDLHSKVTGALAYPAFIVSALFIVGFLMFIYVLPPLIDVLKQSSVDLPFTTKILINVSAFLQGYWWVVILGVIGTIVGLRFYKDTVGGRYVLDLIKIKAPIIGPLFKKIYMARFARNLSTLIAGGIPIVKSLQAVAEIVSNVIYRDIILEASTDVSNGKSIAMALNSHNEFPAIVGQMIQIGESTGRLQDITNKLALFYEKEVDGVLKILTTLMEPIIMMLLGLAVAVMVAGILLPIYNLASAA